MSEVSEASSGFPGSETAAPECGLGLRALGHLRPASPSWGWYPRRPSWAWVQVSSQTVGLGCTERALRPAGVRPGSPSVPVPLPSGLDPPHPAWP